MTRIALITGAAHGLGCAIAERLATDGCTAIIGDIDNDQAKATALAISTAQRQAIALHLDVGDEASVAAAYADVSRRFGRLDILVNNAGITGLQDGKRVTIADMSLATWENTLRTNLTGTLLMCRGAIPLLRQCASGRIVNISSRSARGRTGKNIAAYAASKSAIIGLTQVLAGELGSSNITANCVAPSTVDTSMTRAASAGDTDYFARQADNTLVGRIGTTTDVADAVAFLCSTEAAFITGTVLDVNGGATMA